MSTAEDAAAAQFRIQARVQRIVLEARSHLANSLVAQKFGDDGEEWLQRCYSTLEQLGPRERVYAIVVAMSARASIDADELIGAGRSNR
jgi:hypothetical protein